MLGMLLRSRSPRLLRWAKVKARRVSWVFSNLKSDSCWLKYFVVRTRHPLWEMSGLTIYLYNLGSARKRNITKYGGHGVLNLLDTLMVPCLSTGESKISNLKNEGMCPSFIHINVVDVFPCPQLIAQSGLSTLFSVSLCDRRRSLPSLIYICHTH